MSPAKKSPSSKRPAAVKASRSVSTKNTSLATAKTLRTGPKEVFLQLMMMAMLYLSVISLVMLAFAYIEFSFPDVLNYYPHGTLNTIRLSSAMLVVSFPLLLIFSWLIQREGRKMPQKHELKFGKWLVYLTLFVASLTLVIDLIQLVDHFYSGELTLPFVLKVLAVLMVAGAVLGYYLWEVQREPYFSKVPVVVAWISGIVVLGMLSLGFVLTGSPTKQREFRLDEQRIYDLQAIQGQLIEYWQRKEALPQTLDELENSLGWFQVPTDPETQAPYAYEITDDLSFNLCATFAHPTPSWNQSLSKEATLPHETMNENWRHGAGEECFERNLDPELYPPLKAVPLPVQL